MYKCNCLSRLSVQYIVNFNLWPSTVVNKRLSKLIHHHTGRIAKLYFDQSQMEVSQYVSLKHISYQNHLAAIKIQRVLRGHYERIKLWEYGGVLFISMVAKIQRCYRGLQVGTVNV